MPTPSSYFQVPNGTAPRANLDDAELPVWHEAVDPSLGIAEIDGLVVACGQVLNIHLIFNWCGHAGSVTSRCSLSVTRAMCLPSASANSWALATNSGL